MAEYDEPLTKREKEILQLVATGVTNREIAYQLSISVNTVKVHLRNIFTKLGAESRTEATMVAVREGWVPVESVEAVRFSHLFRRLPRSHPFPGPSEWR